MKKILLLLMAFLALNGSVYADGGGDGVILHVKEDPPINGENPYPRSPIYIPTASLDGHTFYINGGHADFVVQLLDEDDNVAYQTVMPSDVSSIVLPSALSGTYQIQLLWGGWMLYGWINL
jgi:hypothetical protein